MRNDLEEKLGEKYPFMKKGRTLAEQRQSGHIDDLYSAFGCECSNGWFNLLDEMCAKINDAYIEEKMKPDIIIDQIKEKYGTLRFYYHFDGNDPFINAFDAIGAGTLRIKPKGDKPVYEKISEIVSWGEEQSGHICEICGKPGELRNNGWLMLRCDECWKKQNKHRI